MAINEDLLKTIQALNDFPETPYEVQMPSFSIRFRWIHAQCYQFQLPDGKVLLTDPFFPQNSLAWIRENTPLLDPDDLGRVDYVTITHPHYDHTDNLPDVFRVNSPVVICDRIYARELSATYQFPEYNICPVIPGQSYSFDSFRLDTVQSKHNDLGGPCDPEGEYFKKIKQDNRYFASLNSFGALFNLSYLFTFPNNFRLGIAAGVDIRPFEQQWKDNGPNMLVRQRMFFAHPEQYVEECKAIGGQLVLPMHQDACFEWNADMNGFARQVNQKLQDDGCLMRMLNPQRLKWYTVNMTVSQD